MRYNFGMKSYTARKFRRAAALCGCLCVFFLSACGGETLFARDSLAHFRARTRWAYVSQTEQRDLDVWEEMLRLAETVENAASENGAESSVARFNAAAAGERVAVDKSVYELLSVAQRVYRETDGAYNPAAGIYVDLWGFSSRFRETDAAPAKEYDRADPASELPDPAYLDAFLPLVDFSQVELEDDGGYFVRKPDLTATVNGTEYTMQLSLGGIAKGYYADGAASIAGAQGYSEGYVDVGGSSMRVFRNPRGDVWDIGVRHPRGDGDYCTVRVSDCAVATSGDYQQYYEIGGVRYSHIIDRTGRPVGDDVLSATVLGGTAAEADALATALVAMGREEATAFARTLTDLRVIFLCKEADGLVAYTGMAEGEYEMVDTYVRVVNL